MLHLFLSAALAIQAAPADTPPPAAPVAPAAPTPAEDIRFCIAATEVVANMMRQQGGQAATQAAFMEGAVTSLQRERAQIGDTDEAALEAERTRARTMIETAMASGDRQSVEGEQQRFMTVCMPRLRAAFGG